VSVVCGFEDLARANADCCLISDRLPSPKQMQTLLQVWTQLENCSTQKLIRR
jgi:hypothetical protein